MDSQAWFQRSLKVAPGGVHSPVRAFGSVGGTPVFFTRAQGAYLTCVEGRQYIDFCQSFGPNILGHRDPDVEKVLRETVELGWCFGTCEPYSVELAEKIQSEIPWAEKVRFVNSGTEAVMSAVRVARGATGRSGILKFEGCYHGHADSLLVKAGSGLAGRAASDSAGVPEVIAQQTFTCPLDDEAALERVFSENGSSIAALIMEPLPANYGLLIQRQEFIRKAMALARQHGAMVILDEVISGFRVSFGGMAELWDLKPDLVTYGKIIGGGLAVGAYAGRRELMDLVAPAGRVYQAGTLSANPLAMRTGLATLNKIQSSDTYSVLERRMEKFAAQVREILAPVDFDITHMASLFWIHGRVDEPIRNLHQLPKDLGEKYRRLFHAFLKQGIYLAPSGYEVGFLSLAHTEAILDQALQKMREAVREL